MPIHQIIRYEFGWDTRRSSFVFLEKSMTIDKNGRRAYLEGAAEEWRRLARRPPSEDELRRILARFP